MPHASTRVPAAFRAELTLDAATLEAELLRMTDAYTDELFAGALELGASLFVNRASRLVMDPERLPDDADEPMAAKGMGAVYVRSSAGRPLRGPEHDRERVMRELYWPYAHALEARVAELVADFGRALLVDVHSYSRAALPYEDARRARPEVCLGFDAFHDPTSLRCEIAELCRVAGRSTGMNTPFAGSYVPLGRLGVDVRVRSLMIELRRDTYMDEASGARSREFDATRALTDAMLRTAARYAADERFAVHDAFARTEFRAQVGRERIAIRVGEPSAALDALLAERGASTWAYVTAWNPHATHLPPAENAKRHDELVRSLAAEARPFFEGEGVGDSGDWPPERSVLVLGIREADALRLARRFGQEAIVAGVRSQPARLVYCGERP